MISACPTGEVPKLTPENRRFVDTLLPRIMPGLSDGAGGFHLEAIGTVLDRFGVPDGESQVLFDRGLMIIQALQEVRRIKKEGQHSDKTVAAYKRA